MLFVNMMVCTWLAWHRVDRSDREGCMILNAVQVLLFVALRHLARAPGTYLV